MSKSITEVHTNHGRKYLQLLCKHFGHKVPVSFSATDGRIDLPFGRCDLVADDTKLTMKASSDSAELNKLEQVIGSHLMRFAFREKLALDWRRIADPA